MATIDELKKRDGNSVKLGALPPNPLARGFTPNSAGNSSAPKLGAARLHPVGKITGRGTGTSDQVPINASNGEFIIKAAAVKVIGIEALEALNAIADGPDEKDSKAEMMAEHGDSESLSEDKSEGVAKEKSKTMGMKCGGSVRKMAIGGLVTDEDKRLTQFSGKTLPQAFNTTQQQLMGTPAVAPVNNRSGSGYVSPTAPTSEQIGFTPTVSAGDIPFKSDAAEMFRATRKSDKGIAGVTGFPSPAQASGATGTWDASVQTGGATGAFDAPAAPVAAPAQSNYARQMGEVGGFFSGGAMNAVKTLVSAPGYGFNKTAAPAGALPTPAASQAMPAIPGSPAAIAQSATSPASAVMAPQAASAPAPVGMPSPGQVTRVGNSYSGTNVSGDINLAGSRGGMISAQDNQAAENLARRYGQTRGFGPEGAIHGGGQVSSMDTSAGFAADRKQLAENATARDASNANMQAQADYAANKVIEGRALSGNRGALQILNNNARNKTEQRGQDIQAGATRTNYQLAQDKLKLDSAKDGRDATAAGFTSRSAGRIEALQTAYESAKPEDKAGIAEQLRVMTGKDKPAQWKALALQGATDSMGNKTEGVLAAINEQTGDVKRLDQSGAQAKAQFKVGEVHKDANGNRATWDGAKWTPVK